MRRLRGRKKLLKASLAHSFTLFLFQNSHFLFPNSNQKKLRRANVQPQGGFRFNCEQSGGQGRERKKPEEGEKSHSSVFFFLFSFQHKIRQACRWRPTSSPSLPWVRFVR